MFWTACNLMAGIALWVWYPEHISFWKGLVPDLNWIYRVEVLNPQESPAGGWKGIIPFQDRAPSLRVWPSRTLPGAPGIHPGGSGWAGEGWKLHKFLSDGPSGAPHLQRGIWAHVYSMPFRCHPTASGRKEGQIKWAMNWANNKQKK